MEGMETLSCAVLGFPGMPACAVRKAFIRANRGRKPVPHVPEI